MAASTTIVRAGGKPLKFSWDLTNQANPSHITLSVFHASKVPTLTQSNSLSAIFPCVHFCLKTDQDFWHSHIFWHNSVRSPSTFERYY